MLKNSSILIFLMVSSIALGERGTGEVSQIGVPNPDSDNFYERLGIPENIREDFVPKAVVEALSEQEHLFINRPDRSDRYREALTTILFRDTRRLYDESQLGTSDAEEMPARTRDTVDEFLTSDNLDMFGKLGPHAALAKVAELKRDIGDRIIEKKSFFDLMTVLEKLTAQISIHHPSEPVVDRSTLIAMGNLRDWLFSSLVKRYNDEPSAHHQLVRFVRWNSELHYPEPLQPTPAPKASKGLVTNLGNFCLMVAGIFRMGF